METGDIYDVSVFSKHVGSQFQIETSSGKRVSAELVEVAALDTAGQQPDESRREPFSLLFAVTSGADLPQQIYKLSHEALGELQLFMVPLGSGQMESVFN